MIAIRSLRSLGPLVGLAAASFVLAAAMVTVAMVTPLQRATGPLPAAVERLFDRRSAGERAVEEAQRRLAVAADDSRAQVQLASAYLLRLRETGDPAYYSRSDAMVQRALSATPDDFDALVVAGSLANARHDFDEGHRVGLRAVEVAPWRPAGYGVLADALVELGRYDEAVAAVQQMVDLRPDQPSYARVAYLRELHGDLEGAHEVMQRAVQAGASDGEATAWTEYQLGNLAFAVGDLAAAERAYSRTTTRVADYAYGLAGLGRVRAAQGDLAQATDLYERAVQRLPVPELVAGLGDLYTRRGDLARASEQYELVEAAQRLLAANGAQVDVDLVLFNADHGRHLNDALLVAREAYASRPSVPVADALAWIELQAGDPAAAVGYSQEALRLGTRDPLFLYRAGVIAQANGDLPRARDLLQSAYDLNPRFSILWAPDLAWRLAELAIGGPA